MKTFLRAVFALLTAASISFAVSPGVSYSQDMSISDTDITRTIENKLFFDDAVSSHMIDVVTTDGIVTLSGSVDNLLAKDRAIKIAEAIKGVRAIVNEITINPVIRSDEEIKKDIDLALALDAATEFYEVDVQVKNGIVELIGKVDSWAEENLSVEVAKSVKGVKKIINRLEFDIKDKRPDAEIKADIERQLESDVYINEDLIEVSVKDGKAVLSGSVGSLSEKSRAYVQAWVSGVSSVSNDKLKIEWWAKDKMQRKEPVFKSDKEIAKAVKDSFLYDPRVFSFNVNVKSDNGAVTLTGIVDNLKAKKAAEQDAMNTVGVWRVDNLVKVRPKAEESDQSIASNVKKALDWNPIVERHEIVVKVRNKKVYLYGVVDSFYEKKTAEQIASTVKGVAEVNNRLDVDYSWTWKSDSQIKDAIESEFFWSLFVDGEDIYVSVDEGVATLFGQVDSWNEAIAAIDNAFEGGAKIVRCNLSVRGYPHATFPMYVYPYGVYRDYYFASY